MNENETTITSGSIVGTSKWNEGIDLRYRMPEACVVVGTYQSTLAETGLMCILEGQERHLDSSWLTVDG